MNIDKLLRKRKITGEEVGKAIIASLCYTYKCMLKGEGEKTLFSNADLQRMLKGLEKREDLFAYNRYVAFNRFIIRVRPMGVAREQFLDTVINKIITIISNASTSENYIEQISNMPAIMTEKQYSDLAKKKKEEYFIDEDGEEIYYNLFIVLDNAIAELVNDSIKNPKKKSPIRDILKKYQQEPVTDTRILNKYNTVMKNGYYTIEGSNIRSDEVSEEEWEELIKTDKLKKILEEDEDRYCVKQQLYRENALFSGIRREDIDKALRDEEIKNGLYKPILWHYYTEPPKNLTKYDILSIGDLFEYYPSLEGVYEDENKMELELKEQIKAYCSEFRELVEVVIADLNKKYFKPMLEDITSKDNVSPKNIAYKKSIFNETPIEEWANTFIKVRSLYNMGFYGMDFIDKDIYILDGEGFFKGVAILRKECEMYNRNIDENGYYKPLEPHNSIGTAVGLERFTKANEDYIEACEEIEYDLRVIEDFIYYLQGMDIAYDMAIEYTGIKELEIFKSNVETYKERIEALNNLIVILYNKIAKSNYQSEESKQEKLEAIKTVFRRIKTDYEIPEENVKKARELINDQLKAFAVDNGVFEGLLTILDRGLYEEEK